MANVGYSPNNLIDFGSASAQTRSKSQRQNIEKTGQRCLLDETIPEEKFRRVRELYWTYKKSRLPVAISKFANKKSASDVSTVVTNPADPTVVMYTMPKFANEEDELFYRKMFDERQGDLEILAATCDELFLDKAVLENIIRERTDDTLYYRMRAEAEKADNDQWRTFHDFEIGILDQERRELREKCNRLQLTVDKIDAESQKMRTELNEANAQCEKLFVQEYELKKRIGKFEQMEAAKKCLQEEFDALKKSHDEMQKMASTTNDSDDGQLASELESLRRVNKLLQIRLNPLITELADFKSAADGKKAEAEKKMAALKEKLRDADARLRSWKESVENKKAADSDLVEKAMERAQYLESEKKSLQEKLAAKKIRNAHLDDRVQRLEKICDAADASEADYKKSLTEKDERISKLEKELKESQIAQLTEEMRRLREIAERRDNASAAFDKCQSATKSVDQLNNETESSGQNQNRAGGDLTSANFVNGFDLGAGDHLIPPRSTIAEVGRTYVLEAQNYRLRKIIKELKADK